MKHYLNRDQTAKLIELGFEKPPKKGLLFQSNIGNHHTDLMLAEENYSIVELIEILPNEIRNKDALTEVLVICVIEGSWEVYYTDYTFTSNYHLRGELIDALFDMVVELKEEGKI